MSAPASSQENHRSPAPPRLHGWWPMVLALLAIVGLSVAFLEVVRGAVLQGETRHRTMAKQALGTWRCSVLPGQDRPACMARLGGAGTTAGIAPEDGAYRAAVAIQPAAMEP